MRLRHLICQGLEANEHQIRRGAFRSTPHGWKSAFIHWEIASYLAIRLEVVLGRILRRSNPRGYKG